MSMDAKAGAHHAMVCSLLTMPLCLAPPMDAARGEISRCQAVCRWSVALTGAVSLLGACAPDDDLPLPPVVWEGASVRVRMDDPAIQVCGGSFEALDRHAELVRKALLLEGDGVVDYSIGDAEFVESVCASEASSSPDGCTYPDVGHVYTTIPFVPHELVHAVRIKDPELAFLSSPIEEGLATVFGADWVGVNTTSLDAQGILAEQFVTGADEYHQAGQTVAILLDRYGTEAFRDFDLSARTASEARAFEAVFGETKDEFAEYAESVPHCDQSQWWMPLLECNGEPLTADPETGAFTLTGNVSCGEPDVHGPDFGRMWISRHFRLDTPTIRIRYDFEIPDDATLEIVGCNEGCPERFAYIGTRYQLTSYANGLPSLAPGEYFLRVSRPVSDDDGFFEVVLE